jgi:hypothetical protein
MKKTKDLKEAMQSVFDELTSMSPEELLEEINNVPASDIGKSLAYAGAHEVFLPEGKHIKSTAYATTSTEFSSIDAADNDIYHDLEEMEWLLVA